MLTKSPDYIISEYGYPKWQMNCSKSSSHKYQNTNGGNYLSQQQHKQQSPHSPMRLLPLRETLSDYYSRLLQRETSSTTSKPTHHHQQSINYAKVQKNKYNEQLKFNENSFSTNSNTSNPSTSSRRTCLVKQKQNQHRNHQQQQQHSTMNTRSRHAAVVMSLSGPEALKTINLKLLEEQQNELNTF